MGIDIGMGGFGGAIAANIYRSKDSPRFRLGRALLPRLPFNMFTGTRLDPPDWLELMFICIGLIAIPIAILSYLHNNRKRDEIQSSGEKKEYSNQQLRAMGG